MDVLLTAAALHDIGIPEALRLDMGDEMYTVTVRSSAERDAFIRYVQEKA